MHNPYKSLCYISKDHYWSLIIKINIVKVSKSIIAVAQDSIVDRSVGFISLLKVDSESVLLILIC